MACTRLTLSKLQNFINCLNVCFICVQPEIMTESQWEQYLDAYNLFVRFRSTFCVLC